MIPDFYDVRYTEEYIRDQKQLFNYYLDTELFPKPKRNFEYSIMGNSLEFIIRPDCNQTCEYCYLYKHGKELYPNKVTKKEILKNFDLFLDYVYKIRRNYSYDIELFAGDLFFDNIFFDIMDLFDKYFKDIKKDDWLIFENLTTIVVPSNLSWVYYNPEKIELFRKYFLYFQEEYNTRIMFSWSTDGLYAIETREKQELSQEYFDKIFDFCVEFQSGQHPMLSAGNVKNWLNGNYDWWLDELDKREKGTDNWHPCILEVRNDEWDRESISTYIEFLTYAFKKRLSLCDNDINKMAYHLFVGDGKNNTLLGSCNYDFLKLMLFSKSPKEEDVSCSVQKSINLNCTNLSIVLCHRTSYSMLTPIYFVTDNEKEHIIDYYVHNIDAYMSIRALKDRNQPGCVKCPYRDICLKGCFGAQYESSGDILIHCQSVCDMFQAKYTHLLKLYNEYGIFAEAFKNNYIENEVEKQYFKDICEKMGYSYDIQ